MSLRTVFREKLAATERQGFEQGFKQGFKQGFEQAMQPGEINFVVRLLRVKIGDLPLELETKVRTLSLKKIENLGIALLNFNSAEDLINWLEHN
jgi:flagellar biosynthesis/type III secretory pathway protein FliH